MAKAVIPLTAWRTRVGALDPEAMATAITTRFRAALGS
jgi:hypothetical protein